MERPRPGNLYTEDEHVIDTEERVVYIVENTHTNTIVAWNALDQARVKAHIEQLPNGLDEVRNHHSSDTPYSVH